MLAIRIGLLLLFGTPSQSFLTARTLRTLVNRQCLRAAKAVTQPESPQPAGR